jgi:hypothetical protein
MTGRNEQVRNTEPIRPAFVSIQTTAFSGATLLSFLLGAHPQIATVGEMNGLIAREDPEVYLCSCGQKIKECDFWNSIASAMRDRGFEFCVAHFDMQFGLGGPQAIQQLRVQSFRNSTLDSLRDTIFQAWPAERRRLKALVARNEAFIESVLTVTGKQVFVDTSKDNLRLNALRRYSGFDIRAIHLIRDARGVVASRLQRRRGVDAHEAARQWAKLHQRIQITLGTWPETQRIQVRYEDLCQDVEGTLERLYRFCGVDPHFRVADFRRAPHHIVGNPMRLSNLSEISLDERWRSLLTEEQLQEIQQIAGPLIHHYGYR